MKGDLRKSMTAPNRRSTAGLTELETEIMLVLWEQGESTVAQVRKRLAGSRPLAHTTVITMLDRMCEKGVVRRVDRHSKAKSYKFVLKREKVADRLLSRVRKQFFEGSSASMFAHLLRSGEVDQAELNEIRRLLDQSDPGSELTGKAGHPPQSGV